MVSYLFIYDFKLFVLAVIFYLEYVRCVRLILMMFKEMYLFAVVVYTLFGGIFVIIVSVIITAMVGFFCIRYVNKINWNKLQYGSQVLHWYYWNYFSQFLIMYLTMQFRNSVVS